MSDAPKLPAVIAPVSATPFADALGEMREGVDVVATHRDGAPGIQVVAAKDLGRGWQVAATVQKAAGRPLNATVGARWRPRSK